MVALWWFMVIHGDSIYKTITTHRSKKVTGDFNTSAIAFRSVLLYYSSNYLASSDPDHGKYLDIYWHKYSYHTLTTLSNILIWHSFWHSIWHSISDILSGILSLTFYLAFYLTFWSGREHWAWMVAVEVRQGTLGVDGRGWGPAGNTGRGWSRLRSGREHWAWMVVVEVRQGTLGVDGRGWGPTENTVRRGSRLRRRRRRGGGGEEAGNCNWHKI